MSFSRIKAWVAELIRIGPTLGYHPKPAKIFLVTSAGNVDLSTFFFLEEGFKINTGLSYLGGYFGAPEGAQGYMSDKVLSWVNYVELFSCIANTYQHWNVLVLRGSDNMV